MNRINQKLRENKKLLSIYFTAGYPQLKDTVSIIQQLEQSGVDLIEIGLPFSDPLADGPTIQSSSYRALQRQGPLRGRGRGPGPDLSGRV